jgi:hypothetical protein
LLRVAVVLSVVAHFAFLAVAATLPDAPRSRAQQPIEVDVQHPVIPPPQPRPVPEKPKELAMRTPVRERERQREREREPEPEQPQPQPTPPTTGKLPETTGPTRSGPVDLTFHGLPNGTGVVLPAGSGSWGAPSAPQPRREWRPRGDAGDPITGKIREAPVDNFPLDKVGQDEYVYKGPQFSAAIHSDGSVSFDDKSIRDFNGTSGTFDINDLVMRGKKEDPYRHEKQRFLAATAEKRNELQKRARAAELRGALAMLPGHLQSVWTDGRMSAHQRRDVIYQMWREAASGEDDTGRAGTEARAIIEQFIRDRLPRDTTDGYTDEELASYNRPGRPKFAPYP